jgi:hypothetical protein
VAVTIEHARLDDPLAAALVAASVLADPRSHCFELVL